MYVSHGFTFETGSGPSAWGLAPVGTRLPVNEVDTYHGTQRPGALRKISREAPFFFYSFGSLSPKWRRILIPVRCGTRNPRVLTSDERVASLRRSLDPADSLYMPEQRQNFEKLISMYERGETHPGRELFLMGGEVVTAEATRDTIPPTAFWHEVSAFALPLREC